MTNIFGLIWNWILTKDDVTKSETLAAKNQDSDQTMVEDESDINKDDSAPSNEIGECDIDWRISMNIHLIENLIANPNYYIRKTVLTF